MFLHAAPIREGHFGGSPVPGRMPDAGGDFHRLPDFWEKDKQVLSGNWNKAVNIASGAAGRNGEGRAQAEKNGLTGAFAVGRMTHHSNP
ncbi:MAG: hypothetical protein ACLFOY_08075 [Desulfatibacillaceae bacterium]